MLRLAADVRTIMWKEWTEFVRQRSTIVSMAFFVGVFGVFLPLQRGNAWVNSPAVLLNSSFFPVMLVLGIVADAFAGERERHTLETLLASRLTDRAILLGKFFAVVGYAWGLTLCSLTAGLLTVNIFHGAGGPYIYNAKIGLGSVVFGLLGAGLSAGVGVLVSQRAPTVRQAAQMMSVGFMVLFFVSITAVTTLPASIKDPIGEFLGDLGGRNVMLLLAAALTVLDAVLLTIGVARFQRTKLILE